MEVHSALLAGSLRERLRYRTDFVGCLFVDEYPGSAQAPEP